MISCIVGLKALENISIVLKFPLAIKFCNAHKSSNCSLKEILISLTVCIVNPDHKEACVVLTITTDYRTWRGL